MPPRRKTGHALPACVYRKHGAYWLVKATRWTRLGATLSEALAVYAQLIAGPQGGMGALLAEVLQHPRRVWL